MHVATPLPSQQEQWGCQVIFGEDHTIGVMLTLCIIQKSSQFAHTIDVMQVTPHTGPNVRWGVLLCPSFDSVRFETKEQSILNNPLKALFLLMIIHTTCEATGKRQEPILGHSAIKV